MPSSTFDLVSLLKPFTADAVMNGVATLVGAFFGAMLAFLFQLLLHRKQERKAAQMSAQRMLFCLLQQMNTIMLVQKDFIVPHLSDPGRFMSIPAMHEFDVEKNAFDFSTFGFMLETNESRMIMYDLSRTSIFRKPMVSYQKQNSHSLPLRPNPAAQRP